MTRFFIVSDTIIGISPLSGLPGISPGLKGDYILKLHMKKMSRISYGKRGSISLSPGYYLYFGSARGTGGLKSRISRHLNKEAVVHWHIDKLKKFTETKEVYIIPSGKRYECTLADYFGGREGFVKIPDFGCSDCGCPSHLIYRKGNIKVGNLLEAYFQ